VLAGATEFDLSTLDTRGLDAVLTQGEAYVHLRDLAPNEVWSIQTPRGLVRLNGNGRYEIVVGTADQPTLVTVLDGFAEIEGPSVSLRVSGNQTATISGTESFQGSIGPMLRDAFLIGRLNAERPPPAPVGVPSQVALMPGGADLYGAGRWSEAPEYGQVWYPPVSPGWVPYREGHWAYVAPWGWTWIDDAPWGFAPFHYGRWLEIGGRWAWTPGVVAVAGPPVYAPALVTFIGIGAGVALGAALASGSIGWVPLGPREPFRPWYHASDRYVREINFNHVTNNMRVVSNVTVNNFINRGAATSIPAAAMMGSRPVQGFARPVSAQEFASARPIFDRQPLRPTAATAGVTPAVARELNLAPGAGARPAPGPAVHPMAGGPGFAHPAFTPGARPEQARPEMTRPEMTRPELARPGPGNPAFHPGASPAQASPQFNRPTVAEPGARPGESGFNRPMPGEGTPHPQPRVFNAPGAMPGQERHGFASPAGAPHSEPRGFAAPAAAPRPEPHGFTPPSGSRSEPRGFASPAGASRPEPHGFAPQRPEPGRPAQAPRPAPEAHERRPGER
ncbi:MAG TPA: DUF6600 domain-containing protein, partial [Rhodopila sp.]|nr:DUF6600 domain-containing protein [Rhodopila sp.]